MTREAKRRIHLAVVVITGTAAIITAVARGHASPPAIVTSLLVIVLSIRFRYIIGLLDWPISATRLALLLAFWIGLIALAWEVVDPPRWAMAASGLFAIGIAIELHNLMTRQWLVGEATFQRSLRNDILRGIAAAAFAMISTVIVTVRWPDWVAMYVGGLVAADIIRLVEMVYRHRRLRQVN